MKLLILGAGYSGKSIARLCRPLFEKVSGTTRSASNFSSIEEAGACPLLFDGVAPDGALAAAMVEATHLVQSISPNDVGDPFLSTGPDLRRLMPNLRWMTYLSTIGVYGDRQGQAVDETADLGPRSGRSRSRVVAEEQWLEAGSRLGIPVGVLRLSGIYGPGRNAFVNLANGTARRLVKKGQVFNRIRVEDIGRFTRLLIEKNAGGIYNVTDSEPAPGQDVVEYAARLMGVPVPPDIPFETAELSPMARSFYAENKRVSNARSIGTGFNYLYPDYRISLSQMWDEGAWRSF